VALTPTERSLRAQAAGLTSWAKTADPLERTKPGRDAAFSKFEDEVDPEHKLPANERRRRAEQLRRAHMAKLALRSAKARRLKKAAR
jgi:hypothetical protein